MTPLLFTSNQSFSGKSSLCVGVGSILKDMGLKVGYMKPVGTLPVIVNGIVTDEDSQYISKIFGMKNNATDICPIILSEDSYKDFLKDSKSSGNLLEKINKAFNNIKQGRDIILLEGGKSIEDGLFLGISSRDICKKINAKTIVIFKYLPEIIDQVLYYKEYFDNNFGGIIINQVPKESIDYLKDFILPFLLNKKINVFGCITSDKILSSVSIREMVKYLDGKILSAKDNVDELVETFMLGAMGQEQALKFFRMKANKAVITGGDRADIQLAALETNTKCLILTGNFQPSSVVLGRAEEIGVPMILVKYDTLTTVEKLNVIIGHSGFHAFKKIDKIIQITKEFIDIEGLLKLK
ncbi:MAG: phosphotransacetylase family protein [Actinobacteria bacterium]|nr:phosphotransacetylase family protein [Actinomycetota bacterium]